MFAIFAGIAVAQIGSMRGRSVDTVFELMFVLFQGFWVIGWSVGVMILFLLMVLFLLHGESARITGRRLVHVVRLGFVKIILEYDLTKVHDLRLESAGGADRVRIRFDYEGGDQALGSDMPRAVAEGGIQAIQSAIAGLGGNEDPEERADARTKEEPGIDLKKWVSWRMAPGPQDPVRASSHSPRRPSAARPSWTSGSGLALVIANLIPLGGVLLLGWDLGDVITLFWAENGGDRLLHAPQVGSRCPVGGPALGTLLSGATTAGSWPSISSSSIKLFVRGIEQSTPEVQALTALADLFIPLWPALLALAVSHGISFYANFLKRKEYLGRKAAEQMGEPYKRVVVLHVTIIFGGWVILLLGSPLPALVLLVALKTGGDLAAHRKEHTVKAG